MILKSVLRSLIIISLLVLTHKAMAERLMFESTAEQATVLELYTSHGCNSCPPADAWLRRLVDHPRLWQSLIPLSFHVDYWDYLGWRDHLARPEFSQRQRNYRIIGGIPSVYTPGMLLNGREWRGWRQQKLPPLASGIRVGKLQLELEPLAEGHMVFHAEQDQQLLEAYLAVLGFGLATPISSGENEGKILKENFVVLGISRGYTETGDNLRWHLPWPDTRRSTTTRRAIVGWVSAAGNPRPLQAVAGWLP